MKKLSSSEEADIFSKYLSERKIMIVDPLKASSTALYKNIISLGGKPDQIFCVETYHEALTTLKAHHPMVVLSEYELGKQSGLELMLSFRQLYPKTKECLFALITATSSQSVVAQAAEEDVDAFILRPFTVGILNQILIKAAVLKVKPTEYLATIEFGKLQLDEKKFELALSLFKTAQTQSDKPTLALYYQGLCHQLLKKTTKAQQLYEAGLETNKIHFKCLGGLFDVLMEQKNFPAAYEVSKKMARYYPANPKRLSAVLKLAIITKSLDDVERYYQVFLNIDQREDELIQYVCAALVVCGKNYLKTNFLYRGLELLNNAAITAGSRIKFVREIVSILYDFKFFKEATQQLERFPVENQNTTDFFAIQYLIHDLELNAHQSIEAGEKLLKSGHNDPLVYKILIKRLFEKKSDQLNLRYQEAVKNFPKHKPGFDDALKGELKRE